MPLWRRDPLGLNEHEGPCSRQGRMRVGSKIHHEAGWNGGVSEILSSADMWMRTPGEGRGVCADHRFGGGRGDEHGCPETELGQQGRLASCMSV
jgi:hypothetical protein